jgi:multimeric flavodoxin WrbA
MEVLGIYGSPRKGGNSDRLLDEALRGARSAGAKVSTLRCSELNLSGCLECGGCDNTGVCVIDDDMQSVYPKLVDADIVIIATPMFFYGPTAQLKTLIDRCQALWSKRMLEKTPEQRKQYDGGKGYLVAVGATKGKTLFDGVQSVAKYFFDALDMTYAGGVFVRSVEGVGAVEDRPDALQEAFDMGRGAVESTSRHAK